MDRPRPTEEEIVQVSAWIKKISEQGEVCEVDPMLLRGVLSELGANFEIGGSDHASLKKYKNVGKRDGLAAVWGEERFVEIRKWIKSVMPEGFPDLFDPKTGNYDPKGTTNFSGSLQFFGSVTSFAAGDLSFEDFKRQTESRARKGKLWAEGKYEPSPNHPFPPEFPVKLWEYLESSSK